MFKKITIIFIVTIILSLPSYSHATVLQFVGGENGDLPAESNSTSGTVSIVTTPVKHGTYAYRSNPAGTAIGYIDFRKRDDDGSFDPNMGTTNLYFSGWFRVDTCPASGSEEMIYGLTSTGGDKFFLNLNSDCTLTLEDSTGSALGTTAGTLSNTYKLLQIRIDEGASGTYEIKIDGTQEITGTGNFNSSSFRALRIGKVVNLNGNSVDIYFDSLVFDDSQYPNATYEILPLLPNANGTYSQWSGGTANSYTEVDERPNDGNTTYVQSTANGDKVSFDLQDTSTVGITGTVHAVKFVNVSREATNVTSAFQLLLISGATESTTSSVNLSGSFASPGGHGAIHVTDPNTGSAWTLSAVDGIEIGGVAVDQSTSNLRMTQAIAQVLFTPAAAQVETTYSSFTLKNKIIRFISGRIRFR